MAFIYLLNSVFSHLGFVFDFHLIFILSDICHSNGCSLVPNSVLVSTLLTTAARIATQFLLLLRFTFSFYEYVYDTWLFHLQYIQYAPLYPQNLYVSFSVVLFLFELLFSFVFLINIKCHMSQRCKKQVFFSKSKVLFLYFFSFLGWFIT